MPGANGSTTPARPSADKPTLHYIGDPMCSWCWGMAPALHEIARACRARGLRFAITVGGLRAAGVEQWTPEFRGFLRQTWTRIAEVSGQPFGFALLEQPLFAYDTTPACRAVVAASALLSAPDGLALLDFFTGIQRRFYVDNQNPGALDFYRPLCEQNGLDFERFKWVYTSEAAAFRTRQHFSRSQQWGVQGFPSLLLDAQGRHTQIACGYATAADVLARLDQRLAG